MTAGAEVARRNSPFGRKRRSSDASTSEALADKVQLIEG